MAGIMELPAEARAAGPRWIGYVGTADIDAEKHVLVYTVVSTRLINGSPYNSVSAVFADSPG